MRPGTPRWLIILAAVAVMVAASACAIDGDDTGSGVLCVSFLATAIGLPFTVPLPVTGFAPPAVAHGHDVSAPDLPAPPPKA